jgi:hypothetical protein
MSNNIGELFKILGKNEIFANYVKEIENNKSIDEIIELALNDDVLMEQLTVVVSDVSVIKNKMEVIIGQKKKSYDKKNNESAILENSVHVPVLITDKFSRFTYKPINENNIVWLNEDNYLEKIDYKLRLVNIDFELYY